MDQIHSLEQAQMQEQETQTQTADKRKRKRVIYSYLKKQQTKLKDDFLEVYQEKLDWENELLPLLARQNACLEADDRENYLIAAKETEVVLASKTRQFNRYMVTRLGTLFQYRFTKPIYPVWLGNEPLISFATKSFPYYYVPNTVPAANWVEYKENWNNVISSLLQSDIDLVNKRVKSVDDISELDFAEIWTQMMHNSIDLFNMLILRKEFPPPQWPAPTYASMFH